MFFDFLRQALSLSGIHDEDKFLLAGLRRKPYASNGQPKPWYVGFDAAKRNKNPEYIDGFKTRQGRRHAQRQLAKVARTTHAEQGRRTMELRKVRLREARQRAADVSRFEHRVVDA